jgi:uncharacterized protein (DUF2384 family)
VTLQTPAFPPLESAPYRIVDTVSVDLDVPITELARALGADPRTVERWRSGTYPQRETRQRLADLQHLHVHLRDTFASAEALKEWVHGPNRYLGGLSPADAIRVGRFDRVEAALEALDSGVFI